MKNFNVKMVLDYMRLKKCFLKRYIITGSFDWYKDYLNINIELYDYLYQSWRNHSITAEEYRLYNKIVCNIENSCLRKIGITK